MSGGWSSKKNMASGRQYALGKTPTAPIAIGANSIKQKKEKEMNFIKRKLRDWLFPDEYATINVAVDDGEDIRTDDGINFNVINASGGRIVQVRYYDPKSDCHKHSLHIITPEEDTAVALAHILTLETLGK